MQKEEHPSQQLAAYGNVLAGFSACRPCLPFGLCSAPKIFTSLADAAEWILHQAGINFVIHNLDNFLLDGPPESREYTKTLEI